MRNFILFLILATIWLAFPGCATAPPDDAPFSALVPRTTAPESITIKTGGPPGQHFTLALDVDGEPRELSGVTPAAFAFQCVVVTGQVTRLTGDGPFNLEFARDRGSVFTPAVSGVFRFRYHDGGIETSMLESTPKTGREARASQ